MDEKSQIRQHMLVERRALSVSQYLKKSVAIFARIREFTPMTQADTVLTYVSSKDNEVDTWAVIQWALNQEKRVLVPKIQPGKTLAWHEIHSLDTLERNAFGIFEPLDENPIVYPLPNTAPVLVPGLAFTRQGYRVGYGAGYFDRFLARHGGIAIGLAFDFQLIETIPTSPHDIPVQVIITDREVIGCNRSGFV